MGENITTCGSGAKPNTERYKNKLTKILTKITANKA